MITFNSASGIALVAYSAIAARWAFVIHKYQQQVLEGDQSYQYKDHPVFKGLLLGRAAVLGAIAPVMAFVKPSYLNQFIDGVQLPSARRTVPGNGRPVI